MKGYTRTSAFANSFLAVSVGCKQNVHPNSPLNCVISHRTHLAGESQMQIKERTFVTFLFPCLSCHSTPLSYKCLISSINGFIKESDPGFDSQCHKVLRSMNLSTKS